MGKIKSLFTKIGAFFCDLGKAVWGWIRKAPGKVMGLFNRLLHKEERMLTKKGAVREDDGVSSYAELNENADSSPDDQGETSAVTKQIVAAAYADAAAEEDDDDDDDGVGEPGSSSRFRKGLKNWSERRHHRSGSKRRKRIAEIMKAQPAHNKSLKTRIRVLVLSGIAIAVVFTIISIVLFVSDLIVDSAYGKMLNLVSSYGHLVSEEENVDKAKLTADQYREILDGVKIEDVDDSYCYVLHRAGVVLYHPDDSMIGKPNKIANLNSVIGDLNIGKVPESLCSEYEVNGEKYYCAYYVTDIWNIVVICANGDELMNPMRRLIGRIVAVMLIVGVCAFFITTWVANRITDPIGKIIKVINATSELNLQLPGDIDNYLKRADETGQISRAVALMSNSLTDIVENMENASSEIEENMIDLEDSSKTINKYCIENSVTAGQLAAGTASVAERTGNIAENVLEMRDRSGDISKEAENCVKATEAITKRAQDLQSTTAQSISKTQAVYSEIKNETAIALQGLKAVSRINALTDVIVGISDETNLLSLNATIEAARAGEAGRGFAVVATEISKLAAQSLQTVSDINALIDEINGAVKNISGSVNKTTDFLEQQVLADYDKFNHVGEQYLSDAEFFRSTMGNISDAMADLNTTINEVSGDVESIKTTMQETSLGVNDISEKSSSVVELTTDNYDLSRSTTNHVGNLKKMLDKFTI